MPPNCLTLLSWGVKNSKISFKDGASTAWVLTTFEHSAETQRNVGNARCRVTSPLIALGHRTLPFASPSLSKVLTSLSLLQPPPPPHSLPLPSPPIIGYCHGEKEIIWCCPGKTAHHDSARWRCGAAGGCCQLSWQPLIPTKVCIQDG
jgi:hypothetical protein